MNVILIKKGKIYERYFQCTMNNTEQLKQKVYK